MANKTTAIKTSNTNSHLYFCSFEADRNFLMKNSDSMSSNITQFKFSDVVKFKGCMKSTAN